MRATEAGAATLALLVLVSSTALPPGGPLVASAGTDDSVADLAKEDVLTLSRGDSVTLQLTGGPWGRLDIVPTENLSLSVRIHHDDLGDPVRNWSNGTDLYDPFHFTVAYLFEEGGWPDFDNPFYFEWWGTPRPFPKPAHGTETMHLAQGTTAVLLVATNVEGYSLTLTAGVNSTQARDLSWALGPRDGLDLTVPEGFEREAVNVADAVHVQRERGWEGTASLPKARAFLRTWTFIEPYTLRAGYERDEHGWTTSTGERATESRSDVIVDRIILPNHHFWWAQTRIGVFVEPVDISYFRNHGDLTAGVENETLGIAFLGIPYSPEAEG